VISGLAKNQVKQQNLLIPGDVKRFVRGGGGKGYGKSDDLKVCMEKKKKKKKITYARLWRTQSASRQPPPVVLGANNFNGVFPKLWGGAEIQPCLKGALDISGVAEPDVIGGLEGGGGGVIKNHKS